MLLDKLEEVSSGKTDRLAVFMPPGAAKSTYASILYAPWHLAQNPKANIIAASHTAELAEKFGRRVRNLIVEHSPILGVGLASDSQAAGRWETDHGGEYFAAGVGGAIAGRRADLVVIDDPIRSREDADSETVRDKIWDWYKSDLYTRLKPGGRIVLIQCLTGDTPVLMGDGSERPLNEIRVGDIVATFDNGALKTSVVRNFCSNGVDRIFAIKTKSGIVVKANERHPFLVFEDGERKWIRTKDLRRGQKMLRVNGANGRAKPAATPIAISRQRREDTAFLTTIKSDGLMAFDRLLSTLKLVGQRISSTVTALRLRNTTGSMLSRAAFALFAESHRGRMFAPIGVGNCASIIATTPTEFEDCYATTATLQLGTQKQWSSPWPSLSTSDFIHDEIAEIIDAGFAEVFDVQIDGTENFIANGLVSHNTRWHEDDLAGRLLADMAAGGDRWDVISLPALAEADDPLGRFVGQPLWPEWEDESNLERKRRAVGPRDWSALYQQRPAPEDGDYFKKEWLKPYDIAPDPKLMRIYGGSDYAVTANGGDFTCHVVVGIDPDGRMYLLDLWRKQAASDEWVEAFCKLVRKWKPLGWAEEQGQIKSGVGPFIDRRQRELQAYVAREQFPTRGDKAIRAQSIRGRMAQEGLHVPEKAEWFPALRSELLAFPAGKHDDQVDALGLVGQLLNKMSLGARPVEPEKPKNISGYKSAVATAAADWKTF